VLLWKPLATLLRIAGAAGNTSVGLSVLPGDPIDLEKNTFKPGRIQAVTREAVLTAKVPEGRHPHWQAAFPSGDAVVSFTLPEADRLRDLLTTAVAACDSENRGVDLTMAGGCVMVESGSDTKGKTQMSLTGVDMTGKGTASFDGLMLRQFFDVIGAVPVRVEFYDEKNATVFHAGTDHDFALMPLTRDSYRPAPKPAPAEAPKVEAEPKPAEAVDPVPVGATATAHETNGDTKPKPKGKPKGGGGNRKPKK
jgi:hypothetical protein